MSLKRARSRWNFARLTKKKTKKKEIEKTDSAHFKPQECFDCRAAFKDSMCTLAVLPGDRRNRLYRSPLSCAEAGFTRRRKLGARATEELND